MDFLNHPHSLQLRQPCRMVQEVFKAGQLMSPAVSVEPWITSWGMPHVDLSALMRVWYCRKALANSAFILGVVDMTPSLLLARTHIQRTVCYYAFNAG